MLRACLKLAENLFFWAVFTLLTSAAAIYAFKQQVTDFLFNSTENWLILLLSLVVGAILLIIHRITIARRKYPHEYGYVWRSVEDRKWKVFLRRDSNLLKVDYLDGPYCTACTVEYINTANSRWNGFSDYFGYQHLICPKCGKEMSLKEDVALVRETIKSLVKGEIDNKELTPWSKEITRSR